MSQRRLWNKDFIVALSISVFLAFVFYLLVTSMVGYAVLRFAAGETAAGFASTAFVLGSVLTRPVAGKLLDVVGRRRLLTVSLLLAVVVSIAYFFVDSLSLFILSRLAHGMMFGAGHTTLNAAAQDLIPSERRSEGSGYFAASMTLASAFGPLIAATTVDEWGYGVLFGVSLGFSLIALIGLPFLRLPEHRLTAAQLRNALSLSPRTFVDAEGFRMGVVIFLTGAAYSAFLAFLATHVAHAAEAAGTSSSASPLYFLGFAVSSLTARLTIGRVQDHHGDNVVLYPPVRHVRAVVCDRRGLADGVGAGDRGSARGLRLRVPHHVCDGDRGADGRTVTGRARHVDVSAEHGSGAGPRSDRAGCRRRGVGVRGALPPVRGAHRTLRRVVRTGARTLPPRGPRRSTRQTVRIPVKVSQQAGSDVAKVRPEDG